MLNGNFVKFREIDFLNAFIDHLETNRAIFIKNSVKLYKHKIGKFSVKSFHEIFNAIQWIVQSSLLTLEKLILDFVQFLWVWISYRQHLGFAEQALNVGYRW